MKKRFISLIIILTMVLSLTTVGFADGGTSEIKGSLVIVGGALESSNADIYNKFIELAGGKEKAKIGIIGAASSKPVYYSNQFKDDLVKYGVPAENIEIVPIAVKNDKTTKDVDESIWAANGDNKEVSDKIKSYTAIWFVGGDQTRITQTLIRKEGKNTLALDSLWEIYKSGAVIGGSSAGAAIMSDPMIAGGNSLGALNYGFTNTYTDENDQENGPAYTIQGLGFFNYGMIDQHFDRKARLGRLVVVTYENRNKSNYGYGVDENTAMVVYNDKKSIEAIGRGGITIVDVSKAVRNDNSKKLDVDNVLISYIECNDMYNFATKEFNINPVKDVTNGYEYYDIKDIVNTGVFSANSLVKNFITYDLVDNVGVNEVISYCFDTKGQGVQMKFRKTTDTKGHWAYIDGIVDHYSAVNVALDIEPITVDIKYDNKEVVREASKEYVIQKGDVLWKVANKLSVSLESLIEINNLNNPGNIFPGQKLVIPVQ